MCAPRTRRIDSVEAGKASPADPRLNRRRSRYSRKTEDMRVLIGEDRVRYIR